MFFDPPLQSGAHLFFWIVCILIGLVAALSFVDFKSIYGPSDPQQLPDSNADYWKSRKHAEDVHREFPKEAKENSTDPVHGDRVK